MSTEPQNNLLKWAPRPAPFLSGLHSLQAVSNQDLVPDVTIYRKEVEELEQCMRKLVRRSIYDHFILRHTEHRASRYDSQGRLSEQLTQPNFIPAIAPEEILQTSREAMLQEARTALRNEGASLIVCAENHSGASAADLSNFVIICRRMIMEASNADLAQFFMVDHKIWPCRITGIYADISALTESMQNIFLERYKWLSQSWPLNIRHHAETLAERFVNARSSYITNLLCDCGRAAGMSDEMILTLQSKWMLSSPGARYRFAQHLIGALKDGLTYTPFEAEIFEEAHVGIHGAAAVRDYHSLLH